ncbi:MAG TPA: transglutaminase domain-containing protein [Kofleriaceae bacterium]
MASRAGTVALLVGKSVLRVVWISTMVLTPLFGFWLASSLAAYNNASQWLSLLVGLLLFPILPVGWDLFYVWRQKRKQWTSPAILTGIDRLVLRTLIINGLFLGGMMWKAKDESFRAIAVRGDWMFDGYNGPIASAVRSMLLDFADRFDKRTVVDNHYGKSDQAPTDIKPVEDTPAPAAGEQPTHPMGWPLPVAFDPIVTAMPDSEQATIESVGAYLAARIPDKKLLVKAIHDYVVNRLHYDYDALKLIEAGDYENTPAQTAEAVFAARTGVCEGYARLMVALGKAAGVEIAYVTGYIRDSRRRITISDDPWDTSSREALEGVGHAWNAVKLDGQWHLIDATWDDPTKGTNKTTYLFVPPKLMALNHFPEDANWQLLPSPISLGDFVRQPMLSPRIGELGLSLVAPTRSQITVDGTATIVFDNPHGAEVVAEAHRDGSSRDADGVRCNVAKGTRTTITCNLPEGEYEVEMFATAASNTRSGAYSLDYVGSILVNSH